ncbi:type VII secretion target [Cellulomonas sp. URHD0024]|uniref:type VII secretion target n=1 Tax=Cellulomonas sp. URHD0024 TaxID=1302620 RepID=UPI0003FF4107|nr:type VII secretion target [Cellulomonas sp. URHD0024]
MSAGFEVDSEVLRRHGARVAQVEGDLATARAAAGTTDLHGGAFGVLCSFLPPVISGVDAAARDAVHAVHEASQGVVRELGSMAGAFDRVDERVEDLMRGIARALDR